MSRLKAFAAGRRAKQGVMTVVFFVVLFGGWFVPLLGYFIPACMVLGIGIALFKGRKWCDWYCPRGSFLDSLVKKISPGREIPAVLRGRPVRISILVFLMTFLTFQIVQRWPDVFSIGKFFVILLTVTTAAGVILAVLFHQRTWCYLCPIGTMQNWVGAQKYPLFIDSGACTECSLCSRICPVQLKPVEFKGDGTQVVRNGDCLKCGTCVAACPKGALSLGEGDSSNRATAKDRAAA